MHTAIEHGYTDAAAILLGCGADVNIPDTNGCFPIFTAVMGGDMDIITMLLKTADLHTRNTHGSSVLHYAILTTPDILELLLDYGADINAADNNGDTVLHRAAFWSLDIIPSLLDYGADPLAVNKHGRLPHMLCKDAGLKEYMLERSMSGN